MVAEQSEDVDGVMRAGRGRHPDRQLERVRPAPQARGIAPADVPAFVAAQLVGALLAAGLFGWLFMLRAPESMPETALDATVQPGDRLTASAPMAPNR